jgi:predicted NACHT family NTPase
MPIAEIIAAATLLWEVFGAEFTDDIEQGIKERWQQRRWKQAAQDYLGRLYAEHSTIHPLGSQQPIQLDRVYTDVYILPEEMALRLYNIHELRADPGLLEHGVERIPGMDLVQREGARRLYILGGPGAGKTTFLKHLTVQAIKNQNKQTLRVPIFIGLKLWADADMALMDYIVREFEICDFPDARVFIEHMLKQGRALVLFDGLDEIPQADDQRNKAIAALRDFVRQYHASPCLITCRRAAVEYTFEQFTYVELADFTPEQVTDMVTKWFECDQNL